MSFFEKIVAGLTPPKILLLIVLPIVAWRAYKAPDDYDLGDPAEQAVRIGARLAAKKDVEAIVQSDNQLNFRFPYKGLNGGHPVVRQHPQYGLDVIV